MIAPAPLSAWLSPIPVDGVRWLDSADEPAFRALLSACYGDSYSYRALYQRGGASRLWAEGRLLSFGEFREGVLVGHTGLLFKDPRGEYVESGFSFIHPEMRGSHANHGATWAHILRLLAERFGFVHQNTTTLHPRAQGYAAHYMKARPVGVIIDYARGELLSGFPTPADAMQALMMTTALQAPGPRKRVFLPAGPFGEWLAAIYASLPVAREIIHTTARPASLLAEEEIEQNEALSLSRVAVIPAAPDRAPLFSKERGRTDLVHVPTGEESLAAAGFAALFSEGYIPVGIRPHTARPDEVIWQKLPREAAPLAAKWARAKLADEANSRVVQGWIEACARAM
jgi:hypothetical protein